jgi:hypothetical protein
MTCAADAVAAMGAVMAAVSAGTISLDEARDLTAIVDAFRKVHESAEIERRLIAVERNIAHAAALRE